MAPEQPTDDAAFSGLRNDVTRAADDFLADGGREEDLGAFLQALARGLEGLEPIEDAPV